MRDDRVRRVVIPLALALVAIGAACMGPLRINPWFDLSLPQLDPGAGPTRSPMPQPSVGYGQFEGGGLDFTWVRTAMYGVLGIMALALLALVVLYVIGRVRSHEEPVETIDDTHAVRDTMQTSIREAQRVLLRSRSERGTAAQAVVDAWAALEDGAKVVGRQRRPEQTPTEFTAALLLTATDAEAECAELLDLYERARFGGPRVTAAITEADVARADHLFDVICDDMVRPR